MDQIWLKLINLNGSAGLFDWLHHWKLLAQLLIIGYGVIWTWGRIRGTQAERLVKGIVVISSLCVLSWLLGFTLITSILQQMIPIAVVSLVIIFQPEIRRGLGYLGRTTFKFDFSLADNQRQRAGEVIQHIIKAARELSRTKTGALIVIEPSEGERDYLSPGTTINADVTTQLLLSIFVAKSPLHDGAVIIRADKIVAAGVILPITENPKLSLKYGTRHRAAIGLSEIYDGLCIVVSEETGAISAANRGMLVRYKSADELADPLSYFYYESDTETKATSPFSAFLALFPASKSRQLFDRNDAEYTIPPNTQEARELTVQLQAQQNEVGAAQELEAESATQQKPQIDSPKLGGNIPEELRS